MVNNTYCGCTCSSLAQIMQKNNISTIFLLGFQYMDNFKFPFFTVLLGIYCVTLAGNSLIITLVFYSKNLQSPMYFFLVQLSICDIMLTTDIVPNMLHIVLHDGATLSLSGCITQFYLFGSLESSECLLLTAMSYDRYLAICNPLHYTYLMNHVFCLKLAIICWLLSLSINVVITFGVIKEDFCGPNVIDHFFCDFGPLLELSCSDTSIVQMISTFLCIPVIVCPIFLIIVSYTYIVLVISKISSSTGRWRSFSTCSSHLTVVFIFYGTLIAMYVLPNKGKSLTINKMLSLMYTVLAPFFNPMIYSLRNKDIKDVLLKLMYNYSDYYYLIKSQIKIK
ncbi:olfactory receptor 5P52-like [Pseudophryne corroboree]|uniref:olfactory receptor 5P52-like n=1 Tax=Pseudophryne corroboree TaxID=495146 RepID=UPI003081EFCE